MEDLGYVDPLKKRKSFDKERILYWISKGAQPSATIHNLLVSEKILDAKKIAKFNISKKKQTEIAKAKADIGTPKPEASATAESKPAEEPKPASAESSGEAKETPAA